MMIKFSQVLSTTCFVSCFSFSELITLGCVSSEFSNFGGVLLGVKDKHKLFALAINI